MGKEGETTLTAIARVFGDTDEDKANGELMAAAPKLLESLEAALGWLDLGDTRHLVINHVYGDKSALNETLRNAKKAILKARGG